MKETFLAIAAAVMLSVPAVSAQTATRTIQGASGYKSVTVKAPVDLVFDSKFNDSIYVEAPADLMEKLNVNFDAKKGSVTVGYNKVNKKQLKNNDNAVVHLSSQFIESLNISGACRVVLSQPLTGKKMQITLADGCRMDADIDAVAVTAKLSNDAMLNCNLNSQSLSVTQKNDSQMRVLSGKCGKLDVSANGNAFFDGANITGVKTLKCSLSGSARGLVQSLGTATLSLSDNASLTGNVQCSKLNVSMVKSSSLALTGECKALVLKTGNNCYFKNTNFDVGNSAKCTSTGNSSAEISCRGKVDIKASDSANVSVIKCGGVLNVDAKGDSCVSYAEGTRTGKTNVKERATTKFLRSDNFYDFGRRPDYYR